MNAVRMEESAFLINRISSYGKPLPQTVVSVVFRSYERT